MHIKVSGGNLLRSICHPFQWFGYYRGNKYSAAYCRKYAYNDSTYNYCYGSFFYLSAFSEYLLAFLILLIYNCLYFIAVNGEFLGSIYPHILPCLFHFSEHLNHFLVIGKQSSQIALVFSDKIINPPLRLVGIVKYLLDSVIVKTSSYLQCPNPDIV